MARCDALEKLRAERDAKRLAVHTAAVRQLLNVADTEGHIQARDFLGQKDDQTKVERTLFNTTFHRLDLRYDHSFGGPEDKRYVSGMGPEGSGEIYAFHPGGANVVLGDGAVRFVSENILLTTFAPLVTRAGGENVDPDNVIND